MLDTVPAFFLNNGDTPIVFCIVLIVMMVGAVYLSALRIPGVEQLEVDGDVIRKTNLFIIQKEWRFQDIDYCEIIMTVGDKVPTEAIAVYLKAGNRKACTVSCGAKGYDLFCQRMSKENIPILKEVDDGEPPISR